MLIDDEGNVIILPNPKQGQELEPNPDIDPELGYDPLPQLNIDPRGSRELYKVFEQYNLRPKQHAFLCALVETCGVIKLAARAVGVTQRAHYNWLHEEPNYAEAFSIAKRLGWEELERIATLRAAFGTREPHWYGPDLVGFKVKYSDTLAVRLLEGNMPEKYKHRVEQDIGNKAGEAFKLDPGREKLTDEALNTLIKLAEKAKDESDG